MTGTTPPPEMMMLVLLEMKQMEIWMRISEVAHKNTQTVIFSAGCYQLLLFL